MTNNSVNVLWTDGSPGDYTVTVYGHPEQVTCAMTTGSCTLQFFHLTLSGNYEVSVKKTSEDNTVAVTDNAGRS